MITLVITGTLKRGKEALFKHLIRGALRRVEGNTPGLRYTKFARKIDDEQGRERFILIAEFATSKDLHDYQSRPRQAMPEAEECVEEWSMEMWEAADIDFDAETAQPIFDPWRVHDHDTESGSGILCREYRINGRLVGSCLIEAAA